jgi:dienelactone hydrolase
MIFLRQIALACSALAAAFVLPATAATGPYSVTLERDPLLSYHTVFRPAKLGPAKAAKLPVVVFAGGGCRNAGSRFRELLSEVASHGYIAVAIGEIGEPDWDASLEREPRFNGRPTKTDVTQIEWAINWLKAEEARRGSRYFHRIDLARLAVMGQSCGGVQAIDYAARRSEIRTLVVLNSGLFADDREMGGSEVKRADLGKITVPTLILLGGKEDIAYDNGQATFDLLVHAPTLVASADYGHRATYFEKDGGLYGMVILRWLDWQLKGITTASTTFVGRDCLLCRDPQWSVRARGL